MTSVSKNVYINKLDDILNKKKNTYHGIIKIKPIDIYSRHISSLLQKVTCN